MPNSAGYISALLPYVRKTTEQRFAGVKQSTSSSPRRLPEISASVSASTKEVLRVQHQTKYLFNELLSIVLTSDMLKAALVKWKQAIC